MTLNQFFNEIERRIAPTNDIVSFGYDELGNVKVYFTNKRGTIQYPLTFAENNYNMKYAATIANWIHTYRSM